MKVPFRQSGGFAGLIRGCDLDSAGLAPAEAEELSKLLREASAFGARQSARPMPDALRYWISITDDTGTRECVLTGGDLDEKLHPLIRYLQSRSRPCKP
jgi:hypothetical protein